MSNRPLLRDLEEAAANQFFNTDTEKLLRRAVERITAQDEEINELKSGMAKLIRDGAGSLLS